MCVLVCVFCRKYIYMYLIPGIYFSCVGVFFVVFCVRVVVGVVCVSYYFFLGNGDGALRHVEGLDPPLSTWQLTDLTYF